MPKENKKRGRRGEKRKLEDDDGDGVPLVSEGSKRRKSIDAGGEPDNVPFHQFDDSLEAAYPAYDRPFFGMLDDDEQEYFKRADEMLEMNSFGDQEERDLFLANVYREADGKELKIAQSQSCSRLMERLIQVSNASQLKNLFQKFSGNFIHLVSHRFASHCCEALFLRAAPMVTKELMEPAETQLAANDDEIIVSMENLYLHTLAEMEGSVGYLMTDRYASHVLRVLLLVLSGEPFSEATTKHLLQSKRKETVAVQGAESSDIKPLEGQRTLPKAFSQALEKLIAESVAGVDTERLRALATHPNGNPSLQLMLKLELTHFGKQRAKDESSIIRTLLPDDPITADSGSAAFINGIVYDAAGSHLVEKIVEHAPAKMFKSLYKEFFKERLASFARNEIAGYVVCRILERMGKDDLYDVHEILIPTVPNLLEKNRTMVIQTLIKRCSIREVDTQAIAVQMESAFAGHEGFDIKRLLKIDTCSDANGESPHDSAQSSATGLVSTPSTPLSRPSEPAKVHFNILAQTMLIVPGSLSSLILDSMVKLDSATLLFIAKDSIASRTLQAALTTSNASIIARRKLIQHFYGNIGNLALDKSGSHVVDCIWEGTHGLAFIRERIAEELAENEAQLRDSQHGRAVWRNWKMDIYKRKRLEWIRQSKIKASNDGFQSFSEIERNKKGESAKTPLQLARERHAKAKASKESVGRARSSHRASDRPAAEGRATPSSSSRTATAAAAAASG